MIAIFKYLNGDLGLEKKLFSRRDCMRTRGHTMRLEEKRFKLRQRGGFFTVRATRLWNSLPHEVVSAGSMVAFKRLLDVHLKDQNIQGYAR